MLRWGDLIWRTMPNCSRIKARWYNLFVYLFMGESLLVQNTVVYVNKSLFGKTNSLNTFTEQRKWNKVTKTKQKLSNKMNNKLCLFVKTWQWKLITGQKNCFRILKRRKIIFGWAVGTGLRPISKTYRHRLVRTNNISITSLSSYWLMIDILRIL